MGISRAQFYECTRVHLRIFTFKLAIDSKTKSVTDSVSMLVFLDAPLQCAESFPEQIHFLVRLFPYGRSRALWRH